MPETQNTMLNIIVAIFAGIAALAAAVSAFVAARQISLSRKTAAADLLLKLEDRFEDPEFIKKRKAAISAIRHRTLENTGDIEEVLDFFETIGLLVHQGVIDRDLAWSSFYFWIHGYHRYAGQFLKEQRQAFPSRYQKLAWLYDELTAIEKKNGVLKEHEWDSFLDFEPGGLV